VSSRRLPHSNAVVFEVMVASLALLGGINPAFPAAMILVT